MTEQHFKEFVDLIAQQGVFVIEMSKILSNVVERVKEGSLNQKTFMLEHVDDEDILVHEKGSPKYLEKVNEVLAPEKSATYVL